MNAQEEQKPSDQERFADWLSRREDRIFHGGLAAHNAATYFSNMRANIWYEWQLSESQAALAAAERERDRLQKNLEFVRNTSHGWRGLYQKVYAQMMHWNQRAETAEAQRDKAVRGQDFIRETGHGWRNLFQKVYARMETAEAQLRAQAGLQSGLLEASRLLRTEGVLLTIIPGETKHDHVVRFALAFADKLSALAAPEQAVEPGGAK